MKVDACNKSMPLFISISAAAGPDDKRLSISMPPPAVIPPQAAGGTEEFKVGDNVWVGGSKAGVVAYVGETKFSAGEWAGVILDTPAGKNDGSVAGVRYFTCEPLYGVFAKQSKLTARATSAEAVSRSPVDLEVSRVEYASPPGADDSVALSSAEAMTSGDMTPSSDTAMNTSAPSLDKVSVREGGGLYLGFIVAYIYIYFKTWLCNMLVVLNLWTLSY